MGIRFLAITQPFLACRSEMFYGNSRVYNLSIGEIIVLILLTVILILAGKMGVAATAPRWHQNVWTLKTRPKSWPTR